MDSLFSLFVDLDKVVISLILVGLTFIISLAYTYAISFRLRGTKSFFITSALTPMIVALVISMVSIFLDNSTSNAIRIATVAVALGLIRFRSMNARADELLILFGGVAIGLVAGLGYVVYAAIFAVVLAILFLLLASLNIFNGKKFAGEKLLKITIPESLEYSDIFDATFKHYLKRNELIEVKTTAMGSLFRLSYVIEMKNEKEEKELIDELRTKNGNLEISILPYTGDNKSL